MKCKNFFLGALAALSIFVFFPTCEIGLGESVDTEPPTGSISSPGVNQKFIFSRHVLHIKCKDDEEILERGICHEDYG